MSVRILSFSSVFPNPDEPGLGLFVRARLQHMAAEAEIKVVAPVPVMDYSRIRTKGLAGAWLGRRKIPGRRIDGALEVFHWPWIYPPAAGAFNPWFESAQMLPRMRRLQRSFPFDVIDAHFGHPEGVAAALIAARLHVPFTVTLRGNETMHARHPLRRRGLAWALRRADRVIAVSEELRRFAVGQGTAVERCRTIPNGVDATVFFPRDRSSCRRKFGLPEDARVILSAGYLIERKGHHRVVDTLPGIVRAGLRVVLVIAGGTGREGHFERTIRGRVEALNLTPSVMFAGHVPPDGLAELMSAADVLCLASTREGWPNVVHEALACGTPVVATDIGGVRDMIPNAEHGCIVPVNDAPALETALLNVLSHTFDRDTIAARARSRSWTCVASEVLDEMRAVVAEFRRSPNCL